MTDRKTEVVYIGGKMRGLPDYGRHHFMDAEEELKHKGYIVLNPASLPIGMPDEKYMPICLAMLEAADYLYLLDGWKDSTGAQAEYAYALCQRKSVMFEGYDGVVVRRTPCGNTSKNTGV